MSTTEISFHLDLGPDIPNEYIEIARQQGENPETICSHIQELRDMIFGSYYLKFKKIKILI